MSTTGIDGDGGTSAVLQNALQAAGWDWTSDKESFMVGVALAFHTYGEFVEAAFADDAFWTSLEEHLGGTDEARRLVTALSPQAQSLTDAQYRLLLHDAYATYISSVAVQQQVQHESDWDRIILMLKARAHRWDGQEATWTAYAESVVTEAPTLEAAMGELSAASHDGRVSFFAEQGLLPDRQQALPTFEPGYVGPEVDRLAEFLDYVGKMQKT